MNLVLFYDMIDDEEETKDQLFDESDYVLLEEPEEGN